MKKLFAEYGDVIIEVIVIVGLASLVTIFLATNGTVQTMFGDLFGKLTKLV